MVIKQYIQLFIILFIFFSFYSSAQNVKNEFVVVVDAVTVEDPEKGNGYFEKHCFEYSS